MIVHHHSELVLTVEGLLSRGECEALIDHADATGFDEAPITTSRGPVMRKDIRDNYRLIEDDAARAVWLWERLAPHLALRYPAHPPIGLNERWRFYRYDPGQSFAPHLDGAYVRPNGERSYWTVMAYLNEGFEGGETRFFDGRGDPVLTIRPRQGQALLFAHRQLHEGAPVQRGRKYALRTDLMFAAR